MTGSPPSDDDAVDDSGDGDSVASVPFPGITSCDQVTAAIPGFVGSMSLVGDSVDDGSVMCMWAAPEGGPYASILISQNTMPTDEEAKTGAKMINLQATSFTSPELSGLGGVGWRWTADGGPDTTGYSTVYVPGVSVEIHRGKDGPDGDTSYAPADTEAIDVTLAILKL
ncbi:predicted NADH:ubiquinone oxidoreductase, subunit RnfD [Microbacterium testaceum StLB037]|uniref:Predicted NADH:ubiquinone oxidoreductase, subunit RnfD n=1 Tax=Microbacterium testaceum (strain StLB037) TaxID=979556 RepID=E8N7D0_MICTS|nr:hypothetical protein [Microbacterium testaceum]BAJ75562.1 predicted NADH:ubiquinone oxidoreductase, subunit RnfD [Microbacterium testaceum StLB037]